jgi:predicted nucleic acid-binding protein
MISLVNEFSAVLDTCVLLPISLCDLFLKLAEDPAFYSPRWSQSILDELERNLRGPKFNLPAEKATYRIACMESAFPEAMITGCEVISDSMPITPKDRHVLAAAVCGHVDAIVTSNLRDVPVEVLRGFGIERLSPDDFLLYQWGLDNNAVLSRLEAQTTQFKKDMRSHMALLARMVPKFSQAVTTSLDIGQDRPGLLS